MTSPYVGGASSSFCFKPLFTHVSRYAPGSPTPGVSKPTPTRPPALVSYVRLRTRTRHWPTAPCRARSRSLAHSTRPSVRIRAPQRASQLSCRNMRLESQKEFCDVPGDRNSAYRRQPNSSNAAHRRSCAIRLAVRLIRGTAPKGAKMFATSDMTSRCEAQSSRLVPYIAHDEASSAGLTQWADLENWLQDHQRCRAVQSTVSSTSLFGMTWLVLSNKTLQPKPLNRRIPERENGAVDRKSASLGRWGAFMW